MSNNPHDDPAALKALQDDIYREKILRARSMTPEQRLSDVFELTNSVFQRMHAGAMWQLNTNDEDVGWREVRRRMDRLTQVHDHRRFAMSKPTSQP
ncbi:MAG: hypothetical protein WEB60_06870 [Terrimicrobiaceae bacterium]